VFIILLPTLLASIVGLPLLGYLQENKLCTCIAKVPFTILLVILISVFPLNTEALFLLPFLIVLTVGTMLTGGLSDYVPHGLEIGKVVVALSTVAFSIPAFIKFGFPDFPLAVLGVLFIYSVAFILASKVDILETLKEYIYTVLILSMGSFAFVSSISVTVAAGIITYCVGELILQMDRISNSIDESKDYAVAKLYLLGLSLMIVPF